METAEQICQRELQALRSALQDNNVEHACKQLNERGRAQELIRQQYSGRYPFELLQNANDAARELEIDGTRSAYFLLTETALIVADDGAGFHESQIRSICSLGASSKGPGTAIGHKGLGFKSVGEITARPQIVSRWAEFQFDENRVRQEAEAILGPLPDNQYFPVYAFPFPLLDHDLGDDRQQVRQLLQAGYTTVIRLPLDNGVDRATVAGNLLDHLSPNLLLFLPSIGQLELHGTSDDFVASIRHEQDGAAWNTLLEVNGEIEKWLIYRDRFFPEAGLLEPLGDAWSGVETISVSIAVPLDPTGQPKTNKTFPLNVYFPTDEFAGLRVIIHAEWIMTLDRKHISDTPEATPLNQAILREVTNFVSDIFAVDLVDRFGFSREAVHALVPAMTSTVTPGSGKQLRGLWIEALARSAFVPSAGGELQRPSGLRLLPAGVSSPEMAHEHAELDQAATIRPDLEGVKALRALITDLAPGAEMTWVEYVQRLKSPKPSELSRYYGFLVHCRRSAGEAFMMALTKVSCILTSQGDWVAPGLTTVYLPRARGEAAIPENIPVPIAIVPDDIENFDRFLEALGVKTFQWRTIIENYLMVLLRDPQAEAVHREDALDSLRVYHVQRRGEEVPAVLEGVLLQARSSDGRERRLRRSGDLYFGHAWTGSTDLEILYGPLGRAEFLDVEPPEDVDQLAQSRSFYEMLGVLGRPRMRSITRPGGLHFDGSHPHAGPLFFEWLRQSEIRGIARNCPAGHPNSQRLKESHQLDRLTEILKSADPVRMRALWHQLARYWDMYKPAMRAVFRCTHSTHVGDRDRPIRSLLSFALTSSAWIPTMRRGEEELVRPADAWYEAADTPRKLLVHIPRIRSELLDHGGRVLAGALGVTDAARASVDDLVTLLGRLAADADKVGEVNTDLTYAARWVQRRLNDSLHQGVEPHPKPEGVRLLARQAGVKMFVAQPAYADEQLLRSTWESLEPILISDSLPRLLARYLSLTSLERTVKTVPRAAGRHYPGSEAHLTVSSHIDQLKPYVLALIKAENQSVEDQAENRLRTLELIVCEELVLRYVRDEIDIPRPDASCYIDARVVQKERFRRRVGTAYIRLLPDTKSGRPDWYAFASQLAEFLEVPALSDAIATIFTAAPDNRWSMLAQHSVERSDVAEARRRLSTPELEEDEADMLAGLLPTGPTLGVAVVPGQDSGNGVTKPQPSHGERFGDPLAVNDQPLDNSPAIGPVFKPPPVVYEKVKLVNARPGAVEKPRLEASGNNRSSTGVSSAPTIQTDQLKRDVGERGEEIVLQMERDRLERLGLDASLVDWVSRRDAYSPHDITSVEDGQLIYIEVKSTIGSDPSDPFEVSRGELLNAAIHRDRFYIYRVTDVYSEAPTITRFRDPFGLVMDEKGEILLSKATMSLITRGVAEIDDEVEANAD